MEIHLQKNNVLIKLEPPKTKKIGNIFIPETVTTLEQRFVFGYVFGIGGGKRKKRSTERIPIVDFKLGDRVMIPKFTGTKIIIDQQDYVIVKDFEIYAAFE